MLKAIAASRFGDPGKVNPNAQAGNPFRLRFNSSRSQTEKKAAKEHMSAVKKLVGRLEKAGGGQLTAQFLQAEPGFVVKV